MKQKDTAMNKYQIAGVVLMSVLLPLAAPSGSALALEPEAAIAPPRIERFDLDAPTRLAPGQTLTFRMSGTTDSVATVRIGGVKGKITLREVRPGYYEGTYIIRPEDEIVGDSLVIGNLYRDNRELSTVLGRPLVNASIA